MNPNDFMKTVTEYLSKKFQGYASSSMFGIKTGLPAGGDGVLYFQPENRLEGSTFTAKIESCVLAHHLDGQFGFYWGVKRQMQVPHAEQRMTALELWEMPVKDSGLIGYVARKNINVAASPHLPAHYLYEFATRDFSKVTETYGTLEGISIGKDLDEAIRTAINQIVLR